MIVGKYTLENAVNWKNEYFQEGYKEGYKKGYKIGYKIGYKRGLRKGWGIGLRCVIEGRFGTIPDSVNSYIEASDFVSLVALLRFANRAESLQAITDYINEKTDTADRLGVRPVVQTEMDDVKCIDCARRAL